MTSLAIVGVGLIGGSLARAARARGAAKTIVGVDPSFREAEKVLGGDVDSWCDPSDAVALAEALSAVDVIVLAAPVRVILQELDRMLGFGATVTDCGSTKRAIAQAARKLPDAGRFVPGHPMAGLPAGSVAHASAELFVGRRWILCPEASARASLERVEELVRGVGAIPVTMAAEEHDRAVALTSHVPQVLASVLGAKAAESGAEIAAGPGFASATRVAGGSADIWRDIFATNADEVCRALADVCVELERVRAGLERQVPDTGPVMELVARARRARGRRSA